MHHYISRARFIALLMKVMCIEVMSDGLASFLREASVATTTDVYG